MKLPVCAIAALILIVSSCSRPTPAVTHAAPAEPPRLAREVRVTGTVEAVHSTKILVPQISGQFNRMTLTKLIANGSRVKEGDLIATFDATQQIDTAREAQAKYEDLG